MTREGLRGLAVGMIIGLAFWISVAWLIWS
jgi:hypothetical protein